MTSAQKRNMQQHPAPVAPVQLDSAIAIRIAMGAKMTHERTLMSRPDLWHSFTVLRGAQFDKETVLKAILKNIEPHDLIPVNYQVLGDNTWFIARNCGPALKQLCKTNLIIKNVAGDAIILMITLAFVSIYEKPINVQPLLLTALTKRYDPNKKILNLENFHRDPGIEKTVYCPLSQIRTSVHVLKLAKTAIATFEHLSLQNNELLNISAIESAELTFIKYLDLRHNNLLNMSALAPLKNLPIKKLWLDGNPLCENYSTAKQYVESAKRYCPNLQQLDGVNIMPNMPFVYKDYVINDKMEDFIRKFASHFFALYDRIDRTPLRGLYHKNAFYSLSFAIPNAIAQKSKLQQYTANRNLLSKSRKAKKSTFLFQGPDEILTNLAKLPMTYHDKSSFKYDVLFDNGTCTVISISGLFKKLSSGTNILSFSRTFVLQASYDDEYHILNDQYHVFAAPEDLTPEHITVKYTYNEIEDICFSPKEKAVLLTRMKQITKLSKEWAENYLLGAQWNMREALTNFMQDLKNSSIPDHAFVIEDKKKT